MLFNPNNEFDRTKAKEYFDKLMSGNRPFEIKAKNPPRSLKQNSYLHLLLGYFASEYGCSLDEAKLDFFKRECNRVLFERKRTNKQGKEIATMRSSADLDSKEMTLAIDRFRSWSASVAGIYLPAPNEEQFLIHMMQEIERNKEYL